MRIEAATREISISPKKKKEKTSPEDLPIGTTFVYFLQSIQYDGCCVFFDATVLKHPLVSLVLEDLTYDNVRRWSFRR